jgi:hypothetical protein
MVMEKPKSFNKMEQWITTRYTITKKDKILKNFLSQMWIYKTEISSFTKEVLMFLPTYTMLTHK